MGSRRQNNPYLHAKMKQNPSNLPPLRISDKTRFAIKPDGTRLPVLDGKFTFIIEPNEEDIKNGVPGDPTRCMYCLACKRMYGCDLAVVTRRVAYIELRGPGGRLQLRRFILKKPAQMQVKDFDRGDVIPEAVIFAAPHGKNTLDASKAKYQKDKLQPKAKKTPRKKLDRPHTMDSFQALRVSGTGMFQFPRGQKAIA